ncbi:MAG: NlpC/P60 family protein [Vitreimonas sp.]
MTLEFVTTSRREATYERALVRLVGAPYKYGGRSMAGIDCSSLLVSAIRQALRLTVTAVPWMTAHQLAVGHLNLTERASRKTSSRSALVFFDWDEDRIYEHAAARLGDNTWVWASSTAGKVVRVNPDGPTPFNKQWREIEGALNNVHSRWRTVNWSFAQGAGKR